MQFEQRILALPLHGFDQGEAFGGVAQEFCFEEAVRGYFVGGIGIDDDAAPHAHARVFFVDLQGADGYVEDGLLARKKSDGAGVDAARCGLELREQLHGPHLGRTGHGTAGKEGSKMS